jgi:hypothetical protein
MRVLFNTDQLTDFESVLERCEAPLTSDGAIQLTINLLGVDVPEPPDDATPIRNRSTGERKEPR